MCGGDIHMWDLLTCGGDIHVWDLLTCGGDIHVWELLMCGGDIHVWDLLTCGGDIHMWDLLTCVTYSYHNLHVVVGDIHMCEFSHVSHTATVHGNLHVSRTQ